MNTLEIDNQVNDWMNAQLLEMGIHETLAMGVKVLILSFAVFLLSFLINWITKYFIIHVIERIIRKTKSEYDDYFIKRKVFRRLSHLAPATVLYFLVGLVFNDFPGAATFFSNATLVYLVMVFVWSATAFFNAVLDIYNTLEFSKERPLKGYIQVAQIICYFIGILIVISIVFDVELLALFTGLGAVAAVLILVFKDALLGLVASIQLSANKMVRTGDWISMPSHNADGTVLDISLTTVKVQNWDKTISTIPTYALVTSSFANWRGMEQSGGRRIKRSINIDMMSIKFCTPEMLERFRKIHFLRDYIPQKLEEISQWNKEQNIDASVVANGRRLTNIGVFRKYLEVYLQNHPKIHKEMTFLVRQLQSTEKGVPMEIYVFSNEQAWANYEAIQADIFDHIFAIMHEFELKVFQFPTSGSLAFNQ